MFELLQLRKVVCLSDCDFILLMLFYCMHLDLAFGEACTLRTSEMQYTWDQIALPKIMDIFDIYISSWWQQDHLLSHSCCVS